MKDGDVIRAICQPLDNSKDQYVGYYHEFSIEPQERWTTIQPTVRVKNRAIRQHTDSHSSSARPENFKYFIELTNKSVRVEKITDTYKEELPCVITELSTRIWSEAVLNDKNCKSISDKIGCHKGWERFTTNNSKNENTTEIQCRDSYGLEFRANMDNRKFVEFNLSSYLNKNAASHVWVFGEHATQTRALTFMTLGECSVIDGAKHLKRHSGLDIRVR